MLFGDFSSGEDLLSQVEDEGTIIVQKWLQITKWWRGVYINPHHPQDLHILPMKLGKEIFKYQCPYKAGYDLCQTGVLI